MTERDSGVQANPVPRAHQAQPGIRASGTHRIDWMDQPEPFKDYLELAPIPLPKRSPEHRFPGSRAVTGQLGGLREFDAPS